MHSSSALRKDLVAVLPRLRRFAIGLTRNLADADDLVQEACLRALGSAETWDPRQGIDRWAFRILRNLWISEARKRKVRLGAGAVDAGESHELRSDVTGENEAAASQVMGKLAALPQEFGEVLLLVAVEGYSYREAAEFLDIPEGTVMSRLYRARKLLAERLDLGRRISS
jgi:RNA polymerase sigma-70 factor (ECF subfamily)